MEEKMVLGYEDNDEIDLREIFFLFRKNFWRMVLAAVLGALVAAAICCFLIEPTYKATAKLYVVSASSDSVVNLSDLQVGSKLALDYEELIFTRPMMASVIRNLDLDMSVSELRDAIEIENPDDTRILNITVTTIDPRLSADIANETAKMAVSWLPAVMESSAPNIAEEAVAPSAKAAPHTVRTAVIAAVACAALLYAVAVVRFLLDDTIHTPEEMEKYFGAQPMASIPREKSAVGVSAGKKGAVKKK